MYDWIYALVPAALLIMLAAGAIIYALGIGLYFYGSLFPMETSSNGKTTLRQGAVNFFNSSDRSYVFHIPISAACAFGMVLAFEKLSPYLKDNSSYSFEAFDLKFSGPAAPGTLWVICFLALIWSLRVLSPRYKQPGATERK